MPNAGDTFERIDLISTVKELDPRHVGHATGIFKLFGLEFVVILPFLEKILQESAVRYPNLRPDLKLRYVQTSCLSQGGRLRFRLF